MKTSVCLQLACLLAYLTLAFFASIPPVMAHSKYFRQVVFGNTNPRRLARLETIVTTEILDAIMDQDEGLKLHLFRYIFEC